MTPRGRRACAWALGAVVLTGCTSTIPLRHPDGRTAVCGPYYYGGVQALPAALREGQCVGDYQRQGFERVPE